MGKRITTWRGGCKFSVRLAPFQFTCVPSQAATPSKGYLTGLGEMYVADPRFAANYDTYAAGTAAFVRDAMAVYAERNYA